MTPEHVAPHDRGADPRLRLLDHRAARIRRSARQTVRRPPNRERNHPVVEALAADAERILDALVRTGNEAVERHRDPQTQT
jgi:hypothetical protein